MSLQGGIFDIDGVLLDTPHERAWHEALEELMTGPWQALVPQTTYTPYAFTSAVYQEHIAGKPREEGAAAALAYFHIPDPDQARAREYAAAKQTRLERLAEEVNVHVYDDAVRFLLEVKAAGVRVCAASSSKNADGFLRAVSVGAYAASHGTHYPFVTDSTTLLDVFDANVNGHDVPRGKPHPALFLAAAEALGISPSRCFVVEDAPSGIAAARAGGMYAVGVARHDDAEPLWASGADLVTPRLDTIAASEVLLGEEAKGAGGMIAYPNFPAEPWSVRETGLHLDLLPQSESVFALSNGHVGLRGNLDEGEPYALPGSYLNSVYELRPLPYPEGGYGYPESGQTLINITNGKLIRLLVNDEPFDVRYGQVQSHERELDLRAGVLRRNVRWTSPAGRTVKVSSVRMVSFTQRAIAAISYEVEAVDAPVRIVVQSELVANETLPDQGDDPRLGAVLAAPLQSEEYEAKGASGLLIHHTKVSGLRVGVAMNHDVLGPPDTIVESSSYPDSSIVSITARLEPGQKLQIVKYLGYGWSAIRSQPAIRDQIVAALSAARSTGWEGLLAEQRAYLDDFWARADVEVEGDLEIQQAVRFALFHVLQAGARAERRPISAKGLTGPGYDGHAFWDSEIYILPVLLLTAPDAAADALRWRLSILDPAKERARNLGLRGAAFPWRTINGAECSGYWPAGTAAFHVNADIAHAVSQYVAATGDTTFEEQVGLELLVETARLFMSLGFMDAAGHFRIDGVTGPDEYSAIADNNVYTNLMAQMNLRSAAEAAERYPDTSHKLGVDSNEIASWNKAAERMYLPQDGHLGVTPQDETFLEHAVWNFAATAPDQYPLLLHFPYFDLYRKQVVKQADLVLAMILRGDAFSAEQKARNFAYYEAITVRDSSLSASQQSVMAAEVGQLQLAYDYLGEAALIDLDDLNHNVKDGLHLASLAGAWWALIAGFGGLRLQQASLRFAPRLPAGIERLTFRIMFRTRRIGVEVKAKEATYWLIAGGPVTVLHHGEEILLSVDHPVTRAIPDIEVGLRPAQPPGRAPQTRRVRVRS
jgi:alpha,alpha-trehalose phosphorylase